MTQKPRPRREVTIYDDAPGGGISASLLLSIAALVISTIALVLTLSRPGPTGPAAATATPTDVALASSPADQESPSPEPTPQHLVPDLEAMLPKSNGGTSLDTQSTTGSGGLGTDPGGQALSTWLTSVGKTPTDLEIADAYDLTGTVDTSILCFRVKGVSGTDLLNAVLDSWRAGAASGVVSKSETIGGKAVTHLSYSDAQPDDYAYVHGTVVFDVNGTDPTLVAEALKALP